MRFNPSKKKQQQTRERSYLNKDFEGFKKDLYFYAKTYFPDLIQDFSESSFMGMLVELLSYIGDVQSFYLDHQFHETFLSDAVEEENIEKHLEKLGIKIWGASPAIANVRFTIEVPADATGEPNSLYFPIIKAGTILKSQTGIKFVLSEDVDFSITFDLERVIARTDPVTNQPISYFLSKKGMCVSGDLGEDTFRFSTTFVQFPEFELSQKDVTSILFVVDEYGNEYHEVDSLTQNFVYKLIPNRDYDQHVRNRLVPIYAPFRFTTKYVLATRKLRLIFGGGDASVEDDKVLINPSKLATPLYGRNTIPAFTIDPKLFIENKTMGVYYPSTSFRVKYRYGGGANHNVDKDSIKNIDTLDITFKPGTSVEIQRRIIESLSVTNDEPATGGMDPPTIEEIKERARFFFGMQRRIVSKSDLTNAIYSIPTQLGRLHRVATFQHPTNKNSALIFICTKNDKGHIVHATDTLKKNIREFLNNQRLIGDKYEILDAFVINLQIKCKIVPDPYLPKDIVIKGVLENLIEYFTQNEYEIGQPIVLSDIRNIIYNSNGVVSIAFLSIENISGQIGDKVYSPNIYNVKANMENDILYPPIGGIFEIRYKEEDIIISA